MTEAAARQIGVVGRPMAAVGRQTGYWLARSRQGAKALLIKCSKWRFAEQHADRSMPTVKRSEKSAMLNAPPQLVACG